MKYYSVKIQFNSKFQAHVLCLLHHVWLFTSTICITEICLHLGLLFAHLDRNNNVMDDDDTRVLARGNFLYILLVNLYSFIHCALSKFEKPQVVSGVRSRRGGGSDSFLAPVHAGSTSVSDIFTIIMCIICDN